jgi:hypothetical protein
MIPLFAAAVPTTAGLLLHSMDEVQEHHDVKTMTTEFTSIGQQQEESRTGSFVLCKIKRPSTPTTSLRCPPPHHHQRLRRCNFSRKQATAKCNNNNASLEWCLVVQGTRSAAGEASQSWASPQVNHGAAATTNSSSMTNSPLDKWGTHSRELQHRCKIPPSGCAVNGRKCSLLREKPFLQTINWFMCSIVHPFIT